MEAVLDVPPEAFDPPPKVHSAVVRMQPRAAADLGARDHKLFAEVVAAGFSQRRKMLRNTLGAYVKELGGPIDCIDLTRRAEDIPVAAWVEFANAVSAVRAG